MAAGDAGNGVGAGSGGKAAGAGAEGGRPGVSAARAFRNAEEIERELAKIPGLTRRALDDLITVEPMTPDGFRVEIEALSPSRYRVWFAGWNEVFPAEDKALDCFFFGLCEDCRLVVESRGTVDYRWTMQMLMEGEWQTFSSTGLLVFPFWREKGSRVLQNRILRPPEGEVRFD